jgi:hypothetical protein
MAIIKSLFDDVLPHIDAEVKELAIAFRGTKRPKFSLELRARVKSINDDYAWTEPADPSTKPTRIAGKSTTKWFISARKFTSHK